MFSRASGSQRVARARQTAKSGRDFFRKPAVRDRELRIALQRVAITALELLAREKLVEARLEEVGGRALAALAFEHGAVDVEEG